MPYQHWRTWASVLVFAALLSLMALFSYRAVQQSREDVMYLTEQDLPLFDRIQALRATLSAIESTTRQIDGH